MTDTTVPSFRDRISSVSEKPPHLKILVYGDPGVGKTVFAAGAPAPLFIDAEHGTRSLLNHPEFKNVLVLPLRSWEDLENLFLEIRAGEFDDIETIVIDSISELQKRQMDELLKAAAAKDRNRNPYLPFQQDYKENTEILRRLVVSFRDLEKNLIITAHSQEATDEGTGTIYQRPAVTPKLASTLEGIMDVLGYLSLEIDKDGNQKRSLQVMPSRRIKAKCRIGGLPPIIENPTFNDLLSANSAESGKDK